MVLHDLPSPATPAAQGTPAPRACPKGPPLVSRGSGDGDLVIIHQTDKRGRQRWREHKETQREKNREGARDREVRGGDRRQRGGEKSEMRETGRDTSRHRQMEREKQGEKQKLRQ